MIKKCLEQLNYLTKQQEQALIEEDYEQFIQLLEERQTWIDALEQEKKQLKEGGLEEELKATFKEIVQLDMKNNEAYNKQLDEVKQQLRRLHESTSKTKVYLSSYSTFGSGTQFDSK